MGQKVQKHTQNISQINPNKVEPNHSYTTSKNSNQTLQNLSKYSFFYKKSQNSNQTNQNKQSSQTQIYKKGSKLNSNIK